MFNSEQLWRQRLHLYLNELRKYGRYIFNDHLKLVLFLGFGFGAYFYQGWLQTLSPAFRADLVIGCILGLMLTMGSVHTLLKEGDRIFLLPLEKKLRKYFQQAFLLSYFISLLPLLLGIVLVLPLYWHFYSFSSITSICFFLGLVVLKGWNLYLSHQWLYIEEASWHLFDFVFRFFIMSGVIYFTLHGQLAMVVGIVCVLIMYALFLIKGASGHLFKWEKAIASDVKKMQFFYRIANMFTDIPHMKQTVKRRKVLDVFTVKAINEQENVYEYLFSRTFLRSSDYLGLFFRLVVIGGIGMFIVPFPYTEGIISVFFLYLIGFQLIPMWKHHESMLWLSIYPIEIETKHHAFLKLIRRILIIGSMVLALFALFSSKSWLVGIVVLLVNSMFSFLFARYYVPNRIKKNDEL